MTPIQQLKESLVWSPLAILKLKRSSFIFLSLYVASALVVFGFSAWLLVSNEDYLRQVIFDYILPTTWHDNADTLINMLFESQAKLVLLSMVLGGALVAASIILFPLKEYYSASFEKDADYKNGPVEEFSLKNQAFEESKLLVLYLTAQMLSLWIGLYPYKWATALSVTLSLLFLFFFFALDLISPTLQRHKISYIKIMIVLGKKPFAALGFGTVFSLPPLVLGHYIMRIDAFSIIDLASIIFMINIVILAIAVPAGTQLASKLLPECRVLILPNRNKIRVSYSIVFLTFVLGIFLYSRLAMSLHYKSQILKCDYDVAWNTLDLDMPSFTSIKVGEFTSTVAFDLAITNPTSFDLIIEDSQLVAEQNGSVIGRVKITGFNVPSSETITKNIAIEAKVTTNSLSEFSGLLNGWNLSLQFEIWPGLPFSIPLVK